MSENNERKELDVCIEELNQQDDEPVVLTEEDWYEYPEELFSNGDPHETLIEAYLQDIMEDESVSNKDKKKIQKIINGFALRQELLRKIYHNLNDSDRMCGYIEDYSVSEMENMDGPWNAVMDITNETIWDFLKENKHL